MKIIFALILLSVKVSSGQDLEVRFDAFLNQTLSGLGDWMKENNFAPSPIPVSQQFSFSGTGPYGSQDFSGEIKDRFYHGAEENISAYGIYSNLTQLTFLVYFTHGTGSSDYITGKYSINGSLPLSSTIDVSANFTRSNQTMTPLFVEGDWRLGVTPDGYFTIDGGSASIRDPRFGNLQLEGMDGRNWEYAITPIVNSWFEMQLWDPNMMSSYYARYMREIFTRTPIVDIIGVPLPPTMTLAEAENFKKAKMVQKSDPYFDEETQQMLQKQFISFSS